MRKFRLLIVALLMGVVVGTLEGCNRRELLDPSFTTQMNVKVDIRSLANVTCDVYNEKIPLPVIEPEMMRVLFYKPGTNIVAGESYISSVSTVGDGNRVLSGAVGVIPGEYEMVIYNFDTRSTMIRNDNSRATIEAYTEPVVESIASRFNTRVDEATDILYQPDHLVVATNERDADSYAYLIESERGIDARKPIFNLCAEKKWAILGMMPVGTDLESIFIRLVDSPEGVDGKNEKKRRKAH